MGCLPEMPRTHRAYHRTLRNAFDMRRTLPAIVLAGLILTGGCIGFLTGEETLSFEADQATVDQDTRSETDYQQTRSESQTITRNFSAAGQTRTVTVTNQVTEYKRQISIPIVEDQELARFTVLSTPKVQVLNRTFNPVANLSNRQLAQQFQEKYETIDDVQHAGDRSVTVLGQETTVSKFSARAKIVDGQTIDVYFHIAQVDHGDDFIIGVAVHPQEVDEQERVDQLYGGITHQSGE